MIQLENTLLIHYKSATAIAQLINDNISALAPVFFSIAILMEYFSDWNFGNVLKRAVMCFLLLSVFSAIFDPSIKLGFNIGNNILVKCETTEFCSYYLNGKGKDASNLGFKDVIKNITNFSSYPILIIVSLLFKFGLLLAVHAYSMVYNVLSVTYPLISYLGILLKNGEKSFSSVLISILWLAITPIILSTVIVFLAGTIDAGIGPQGEITLMGSLQLFVLSLFSLGSLFLSYKFVTGEAVANFGAQMAMIGTTAMAVGGFNNVFSNSKSILGHGAQGSMGKVGSSINASRNGISNLTSKSVGHVPVSPSDLLNEKNGRYTSSIIPKGSDAYKSLSTKQKILVGVDSAVNRTQNLKAKSSLMKDFKDVTAKAPKNTPSSVNPSGYKDALRKSASSIRPSSKQSYTQHKPTNGGLRSSGNFSAKNLFSKGVPKNDSRNISPDQKSKKWWGMTNNRVNIPGRDGRVQ